MSTAGYRFKVQEFIQSEDLEEIMTRTNSGGLLFARHHNQVVLLLSLASSGYRKQQNSAALQIKHAITSVILREQAE